MLDRDQQAAIPFQVYPRSLSRPTQVPMLVPAPTPHLPPRPPASLRVSRVDQAQDMLAPAHEQHDTMRLRAEQERDGLQRALREVKSLLFGSSRMAAMCRRLPKA